MRVQAYSRVSRFSVLRFEVVTEPSCPSLIILCDLLRSCNSKICIDDGLLEHWMIGGVSKCHITVFQRVLWKWAWCNVVKFETRVGRIEWKMALVSFSSSDNCCRPPQFGFFAPLFHRDASQHPMVTVPYGLTVTSHHPLGCCNCWAYSTILLRMPQQVTSR